MGSGFVTGSMMVEMTATGGIKIKRFAWGLSLFKIQSKKVWYLVSDLFVTPGGLEPSTNCLRGNCSAIELRGR